jgi:hypothetical protein
MLFLLLLLDGCEEERIEAGRWRKMAQLSSHAHC